MKTRVGQQVLTSRVGRGVLFIVAVVVAAATMLALLTPAFGADDAQTRIKNFKLSVWPEYDEPSVLVMYQGEFADKSSFPKSVKFRLPKDAEIGQVCALGDKQEHLCQLYEITRGEEFTEVTYTLPIPTFFLEYYYSPINADGARNIAFTYSHVYPADKMDVEVQQPLRATDFSMTPSPLSVGSDNKGFKYSQLSFDNVRAGQKLDLNMAYSKPDRNPSVAKSKQGGGSVGSNPDVNLWLLVGAAVGLAAVVYFGLSRRSRFAPQPARAAARVAPSAGRTRYAAPASQPAPRRASSPDRARQAPAPSARFCSGCGTPLEPEDRFCSACGKNTK